jgi:hypothetical protein
MTISLARRYLVGLTGAAWLLVCGAAYPDGYRGWVHVRTGLIGPQSPAFANYGGMHHIYANAEAEKGLVSGKFPDGAVLVFDLLDVKESNGNTTEGARKKIEIMVKDSQRYASTGGWGFERFVGDGREPVLTDTEKSQCFACHQSQSAHGFVFSTAPK